MMPLKRPTSPGFENASRSEGRPFGPFPRQPGQPWPMRWSPTLTLYLEISPLQTYQRQHRNHPKETEKERKKGRKNKHERSVRSEYTERNEVQLNPSCRRERELRPPGVQGTKTLFPHLRLGFCQKRATPLKPTLTYLKHIRLKQGQLKI